MPASERVDVATERAENEWVIFALVLFVALGVGGISALAYILLLG